MAYTKHTWTTGEIITAGRLNNMEDGIADAGGVMVVNATADEGAEHITLGKTWQEIYDAMAQGKLCVIREDSGSLAGGITTNMVNDVFAENGKYMVMVGDSEYSAISETGYPEFSLT